MSVKERLITYIKYKGLNNRKFLQSVGLSEGYINSMRVSIQPDKLYKISSAYPDLNTGWLLTGEGDMINQLEGLEIKENRIIAQQHEIERLRNEILRLTSVIESQQKVIEGLSKRV